MRPEDNYGRVARLLHWLIAGLIATQYVLAQLAERAGDAEALSRQLKLLANHKSVGITVLTLALVRALWRLSNRPPALPVGMPRWQAAASQLSHSAIYVLIVAVPLTGWLMSSASAYSVSWFNLVTLPDFVAPDPALKAFFEASHEFMANLLGIVVLVHIAAALKHHFIDKDTVLARMSSLTGWLTFVLVAAGGSAYLATSTPFAERAVAATGADDPAPASADAATVATTAAATGTETEQPPLWDIDYDASEVAFTATQAGAEFSGRWGEWSADMRFDGNALAASGFDVRFDVASVDTDDAERDTTLQDAAWFDAADHPSVRFVTRSLERNGAGYSASAALVVKGEEHPVAFDFTIGNDDDGRRVLNGSARLDRLALGIGTGDWSDTATIGQYVDVDVRVVAAGD
ncbi:MAG: cytochrome b/b6 domain-containing protein [Pseudomonadota bacterium]